MKEVQFLQRNREKWQEFEKLLYSGEDTDPDLLANYYINLTDDLSYARTYYPKSKTTSYLNQLTTKIHLEIYRNKKEDRSRFKKFWTEELPEIFQSVRKQLGVSLLILCIGMSIGMLSSANDKTFVRLILGDGYVNMTLENIEKGDPMAVYKEMNGGPMFLMITVNNIKVSFFAFVMGLLFSMGTAIILFRNGIMLGAFQYFFIERGLFWDSFLTIWIHGTLEISAIVMAGAAGFVIGNSFLFPGTFSRLESFTRGAKKGVKIVVGIVPIFIVAGLLESFVTRHTDMNIVINVMILLLSLFFVIFYTIIYPNRIKKRLGSENG